MAEGARVLHLSDLGWSVGGGEAETVATELLAFVRAERMRVDLVAVTGDVAATAAEAEYVAAEAWLRALLAALELPV